MPTHFIDRQPELENVVKELKSKSELALDLEFDKNYHRYGFNLCLVQIYDGENCYLIDPLSNELQIKTLFPVLEDPAIQKITFAFGEDLRLLHSLGCFPKNIHDLDISTSLLNYPPASLTNLLADILEIDTGKSSQMSDWYRRPLTDEQMHYAAQDVLHLIDLKEKLADEAEQKQITEWIKQENSIWDTLDYSDVDDNLTIKEKDKKDLTEFEWHLFKALMNYREDVAEKLNKPSFQIIKKDLFYKIAQEPDFIEKWTNTRGIYSRLRNEETQNSLRNLLKDAIEQAEEMGLSSSSPANKPPSTEEKKERREMNNRINKVKATFFSPIKEKITEDYGKEAATYLFSNRIIAEIVTGKSAEMPEYKKRLLKDYADELNLKDPEWIDQ